MDTKRTKRCNTRLRSKSDDDEEEEEDLVVETSALDLLIESA